MGFSTGSESLEPEEAFGGKDVGCLSIGASVGIDSLNPDDAFGGKEAMSL